MSEQLFFNFNCSFNLRKPKSNYPTPVFMVFRLNNKQYKLNIGAKIYPSQWDKKNQRGAISPFLTKLDNNNNDFLNRQIDAFIKKFNEVKLYLCNNPAIMQTQGDIIIKKRLFNVIITENKTAMGKKKKQEPVFNAILWLRKDLAADMDIKNPKTADQYNSKINVLKDYIYNKGIVLKSFNDIDLRFIEDFRNFLLSELNSNGKPKRSVAVAENIITVIIARVKRAEKYDLFNLANSRLHLYKPIKKKVDVSDNHFALSESELDALYSLNLTGEEEQIRNAFLMQSYTGQRYSDILNIDSYKIDTEQNVLILIQKKTKERAYIPLLSRTVEMVTMAKNGKLKYDESNHKTNEILREVARKAGITDTYEILRETGNGVETIKGNKWEFIGTHTARRTFVTMCQKRGISDDLIMNTTGHKDIKSFRKYDKEGKENKANRLAEYFASGTNTSNTTNTTNVPISCDNNSNAVSILSDVLANTLKKGNVVDNDTNIIHDAKEVLTLFGVDPISWINETDIYELFRLIFEQEQKLETIGFDKKLIKDIRAIKELNEKYKIINLIKEQYKKTHNDIANLINKSIL